MTGLGLSGAGGPTGEFRVGFRSGFVRYLGVTIGGAGAIGAAIAFMNLVQHEPQQVFDLLARWGWVWFIVLALVAASWDLTKRAMGYLGKLADSVQESAVAMNRIADRDDRDQDRMQTEIAFVGRRMEQLKTEHQATRDEMRDQHREVIALISQALAQRGHGNGNA